VAGPAWNEDIVSTRADENLARLTRSIPAASIGSRAAPTVDLARDWHREMLEGIDVPDDAYRGGFRGDPHPALVDYEVTVGMMTVTRANAVAAEIGGLITALVTWVCSLDELDASSDPDQLEPSFVEKVLTDAARLHGEWIKIHPFVNGNGRIARMWVLWLCGRYGLPQLLPLRPRPDMGYTPASQLSVLGDHGLFLQYLLLRYNTCMS
jgi:hypothetical protein